MEATRSLILKGAAESLIVALDVKESIVRTFELSLNQEISVVTILAVGEPHVEVAVARTCFRHARKGESSHSRTD